MTGRAPACLVATLITGMAPVFAGDCNVDEGWRVFDKCAACHSLEEGVNLQGPSLYRVVGRRAGSVPGFTYSLALEQADITWTWDNLDAFLASPMQFLPGNTMPFGGLRRTKQRDALKCLLEQTSR